jgi:hypothetical protein
MDEQRVTAQEEFDSTYITSSEICRDLKITRATIVQGRRRGLLPDPIMVNGAQIQIWKRDAVARYLEAWKLTLQAKRGELTA